MWYYRIRSEHCLYKLSVLAFVVALFSQGTTACSSSVYVSAIVTPRSTETSIVKVSGPSTISMYIHAISLQGLKCAGGPSTVTGEGVGVRPMMPSSGSSFSSQLSAVTYLQTSGLWLKSASVKGPYRNSLLCQVTLLEGIVSISRLVCS